MAQIESNEGVLELDWYNEYSIPVVESICAYEQYSDGNKVVNITFGFIADSFWFSKKKAKQVVTLIEMLALIENFEGIDQNGIAMTGITISQLRKKAGMRSEVTEELLDDWCDLLALGRIQNKVRVIIENMDKTNKLIYQSRRQWHWKHYSDYLPEFQDGQKVALYARFAFAVLDKNAVQIFPRLINASR